MLEPWEQILARMLLFLFLFFLSLSHSPAPCVWLSDLIGLAIFAGVLFYTNKFVVPLFL
jgi:hypothetical protein